MNIAHLAFAMHASCWALQQAWDAAYNTAKPAAARRAALADLARKAMAYGEALERYRCAYVVDAGHEPRNLTPWEPPRD